MRIIQFDNIKTFINLTVVQPIEYQKIISCAFDFEKMSLKHFLLQCYPIAVEILKYLYPKDVLTLKRTERAFNNNDVIEYLLRYCISDLSLITTILPLSWRIAIVHKVKNAIVMPCDIDTIYTHICVSNNYEILEILYKDWKFCANEWDLYNIFLSCCRYELVGIINVICKYEAVSVWNVLSMHKYYILSLIVFKYNQCGILQIICKHFPSYPPDDKSQQDIVRIVFLIYRLYLQKAIDDTNLDTVMNIARSLGYISTDVTYIEFKLMLAQKNFCNYDQS